ncbi:hypothetical protein B0H13DRAFT_74041 [Mycena leptocephala]|nr:hypothetical protein B0H13DRAFT_74041 [Mycena leptocephala]
METGTMNTPAQLVEKNTALQFRTRGVKSGIGMPKGSMLILDHNNRICAPSPKLLSPADTPATPSDSSSVPDIEVITNPASRPFIQPLFFGSPATSPTSLPSSVSSPFGSSSPYRPASKLNSVDLLHIPSTSIPSSISSPFGSPLPYRRASRLNSSDPVHNLSMSSDSGINFDAQFIHNPTLFASSSAPSQPGPSEPSSSLPTEAMLHGIVAKAAKGSTSKSGWPFMYTRDMAAGFVLLDNRGRASSRPTDFRAAFGCDYTRATYSENRRIWDNARRNGVDPHAIIAANDKNTWRKFREKWMNVNEA